MIELDKQVIANLQTLKYELEEVTSGELFDMAPSIGYNALGYGTTYKDGTKGILMEPDGDLKIYNNGTYMLHKMQGGEIVMEVINQNTANKGDLIQKISDEITTKINGMDLLNLNTFDFTEIFGNVVADIVIKPLATTLFPDNPEKQERFALLYLPKFLANTAYLYAGNEHVMEEGVNSEPYVLKMNIDQVTDLQPSTADSAIKKDQAQKRD